MKNRTPYQIIEGISPLSNSDVDHLWQNMKQVLDREMPDEKEQKRFFAWLFRSQVLFAFSCVASLTAMTIHIHFASTHKTGSMALRLPDAIQPTPKDRNDKPSDVSNSFLYPTHHNSIKENAGLASVASTKQPEQNTSSFVKTEGSKQVNWNQSPVRKQAQHKSSARLVPVSDHQHIAQKEIPVNKLAGETIQEDRIDVTNDDTKRYAINIRPSGFLMPEYSPANATWNPVVGTINPAKIQRQNKKGFVAGVAINMILPVSQQEMSRASMNGNKNSIVDYLPSVYAGYHFNNRISINGEFQFVSPQYTPSMVLSSNLSDVTPNSYKDNIISLNKLYYLNLPFTVTYTPVKNVSIGTGVQYSYLKRSVFEEEICTWQKDPSGWKMTANTKTTKVKSTHENKGNGNGNGNGGNGGGGGGSNPQTAPMTRLDTIAQGLKTNDWRWVMEASYHYHRFTASLRFNMGLDNYINARAGNINYDIRDRNKSFMLHIRYDILDKRRKSASTIR